MSRRLWRLLTEATPAARPAGTGPLAVVAAGLCCSVGYHLEAAACALRAGMDHFRQSAFVSPAGHPINVASLPDELFGHDRLQRWVGHAVRDAMRRLPDPHSVFDRKRTAIVVLAADVARAHSDPEATAWLTWDALAALRGDGTTDLPRLDVFSQGRAGLAHGLDHAWHMMQARRVEQVLLIGADTHLTAADIGEAIEAGRLFMPGNGDGFIAGEAAAAVVLRLPEARSEVRIAGYDHAIESGRPDGSVPSRAQGLTQAVRGACAAAGIDPLALEFRLSDQNGEVFFAREAANAFTRVMHGGHKLAHLTLADKIGEVGAAAGPAMLAWLWHGMPRDDGPGATGVIHLASDRGLRCAAVVRHHPKD
jgi:3-oxoacyl-[acyl-carrier-protein] synthase-1